MENTTERMDYLKPNNEIKETKIDLYTIYDITTNSYCINERPRLLKDIFKDVETELKKNTEVWELLDYFDMQYKTEETELETKLMIFPFRWIACYYVKGSNEGFYFHVDVIHEGKRELIFLGKTLSESRTEAEKIQNALARILEV